MVGLKERVNRLKSDLNTDGSDKWSEAIFIYLFEFKMTMNQLQEEPIPTVLTNLKYLEEKYKKEAKAGKK